MDYNKLTFVYLLENDQEQLELFKMSFDTLLKYNDVERICIIYFNCELKDIKDYFKSVNINFPFEYFYFDVNIIDQIFPVLTHATNNRLRYPSLSRWFLTKLIPYDCFWYVDTDILFHYNIREKFLNIQQNQEELFYLFNRKNYLNRVLRNRLFWQHAYAGNCGIIYINSKKYNNLIELNEIIEYYNKNKDKIYYVNQDCYEYLFIKYGATIEISDEYNRKLTHKGYEENEIKLTKIFHFTGTNKNKIYKTYKRIMDE